VLLQVGGDVSYLGFELGGDILSALARLLLVAGLLAWPIASPLPPGRRATNALDILTILVGVGLLYWALVLAPALEQEQALAWPQDVLRLAFPVGSLVMLGAASRLLYLQSQYAGSTAQLAFGAAAMTASITDGIYAYLATAGRYQTGGWLDLGWVLAALLLCLAGVLQVRLLTQCALPAHRTQPVALRCWYRMSTAGGLPLLGLRAG
jgi:hypothetical protein